MQTVLVPARGAWCDLSSTGHPLSFYAALRTAGYAGVFLDLMTPGCPADYNNALAAGLGVMLLQGYDGHDWAIPTQARQRADYAVQQMDTMHYLPGATTWLDCEAMGSLNAGQALAWLTRWDATVHGTGYTSLGKYEGPDCPLTGPQWYDALPLTSHYWRSKAIVPTIPTRGYQIVQTGVQRLFDGVAIDTDEAGADRLGETAMAVQAAHGVAASSAPSPLATLTTDVADLKKALVSVGQILHAL